MTRPTPSLPVPPAHDDDNHRSAAAATPDNVTGDSDDKNAE